ncbi:MAG: hypothetical protein KDI19_11845 [Pseudomonadales bacterium]|nr:hypothetical protein [Pseudomonadales bacterium]
MTEDSLAHEPFSYEDCKNGLVRIRYEGKVVKNLGQKEAMRFLARVEGANARGAQMLMAKVTGQFKFGNEREGKEKARR